MQGVTIRFRFGEEFRRVRGGLNHLLDLLNDLVARYTSSRDGDLLCHTLHLHRGVEKALTNQEQLNIERLEDGFEDVGQDLSEMRDVLALSVVLTNLCKVVGDFE